MRVTSKNTISNPVFKEHKSFSPEDIWAAGGTTAFGKKMGKNNAKLIKALELSPETDPFSDKEWEDAIKLLKDSK